MIGAIIGDIVGSPYESGWMNKENFELFRKNSVFTDDTVLTVAVADAILSGVEYEDKIREYANQYRGRRFGKRFKKWLEFQVKNDSFGNGSAMRVSPIGFAFKREDKVLEEAEKSAACSHNHPEAIKGAKAIALSVYMAKNGYSKEEIRSRITDQFGYDINRNVDEIRPDYFFDSTCKGSVGEAIVAFLDSKDYEDAIRKAVSLGGDADTLACMAGGIAQAYYKKIPEYILDEAWERISSTFCDIIEKFHEAYKIGY
ncbi:MAG: ADP-ribosylglycohydrolase family protein [Flexistipes sinusarabici]|uniref:ADP-ribosylglycohydrolase family protein n=1 Tax=Flexistipes sinusarabici TaxID=2352 RepID=A0A5D0MQB7_FLESI|nr:ADP-ribosylglycohydrolase family protein [Flexistipes sinusarabici]TYB33568.1 MAG: ADP-ribosylglycohydrolase family protein [Flexistipes sinusarabici]